jgi:hypothetical protein
MVTNHVHQEKAVDPMEKDQGIDSDVPDRWLAETRYHAAVQEQQETFHEDFNTLLQLFETAMKSECDRRQRLSEALRRVVEEQYQSCEASPEESQMQMIQADLPPKIRPQMPKKNQDIMMHIEYDRKVKSALKGVETFEDQMKFCSALYANVAPLRSQNMAYTSVVSRRDATRIHSKPALIVVTRDHHVHLFELPAVESFWLGSLSVEEAYKILLAPSGKDDEPEPQEADQLIPALSFCTLDKNIEIEQDENCKRINVRFNRAQAQRRGIPAVRTSSVHIVLEAASVSEQSELWTYMRPSLKSRSRRKSRLQAIGAFPKSKHFFSSI